MQTFILLISMFLTGFADQPKYNGYTCIPSMRDTRFQALESGEFIEILVTSPMGYEFLPQFEAPISVFNIPFIKMQGEDLKDLETQFKFQFPKGKCVMDTQEFTVNCESAAVNKKGAVGSYGITTTEITEKYAGQIYEKRKFRMALENGNTYFVSLTFDKQFCSAFK